MEARHATMDPHGVGPSYMDSPLREPQGARIRNAGSGKQMRYQPVSRPDGAEIAPRWKPGAAAGSGRIC